MVSLIRILRVTLHVKQDLDTFGGIRRNATRDSSFVRYLRTSVLLAKVELCSKVSVISENCRVKACSCSEEPDLTTSQRTCKAPIDYFK